MNPEQQPFIRLKVLISRSTAPEVLAFLRSLPTSSAPLKSMVVEFVGTDDGKAIAGTYLFNHFCKYRRTLATFKRFRAFIATHSRHVVLSPLEELLAANIQCFANNTSLRSCWGARPLPRSTVVRSERLRTDGVSRFAFATTYQVTSV